MAYTECTINAVIDRPCLALADFVRDLHQQGYSSEDVLFAMGYVAGFAYAPANEHYAMGVAVGTVDGADTDRARKTKQ